jgi:hypothetical protein
MIQFPRHTSFLGGYRFDAMLHMEKIAFSRGAIRKAGEQEKKLLGKIGDIKLDRGRCACFYGPRRERGG